MAVIHDWPGFRSVVRSSFFEVKRASISRSIFAPVSEREDLGTIWRASVTLRPAFDNPERGAIEQFIRSMAAEDYLRFWDLDYFAHGPYGTGGIRGASVRTRWTTGARLGSAFWAWSEGLTLAADLGAQDRVAFVRGARPGEVIARPGDTFGIYGEDQSAAFVTAEAPSDRAGRFRVVLDRGQGFAARAGDRVEIGKRFLRVFQVQNLAELADNATQVNGLPSYQFTMIEAPNAGS